MNYSGYLVHLYLRQSSRIGRDAKTIGALYMVSVRTSYEEGATEDIAGSNPASDTKTKPHKEWNNHEKARIFGFKEETPEGV